MTLLNRVKKWKNRSQWWATSYLLNFQQIRESLQFLHLQTYKHDRNMIEIMLIIQQLCFIVSLPGGRDCFNFSAFSLSVMTKVYKNREQRTLNLVFSAFFFILTDLASFLRAFSRKSLISIICLGYTIKNH